LIVAGAACVLPPDPDDDPDELDGLLQAATPATSNATAATAIGVCLIPMNISFDIIERASGISSATALRPLRPVSGEDLPQFEITVGMGRKWAIGPTAKLGAPDDT